jgi:hypothetical protein
MMYRMHEAYMVVNRILIDVYKCMIEFNFMLLSISISISIYVCVNKYKFQFCLKF